MTSEGQRALIHLQKMWYDQLWLSWNGFYSPIVKRNAKENKIFAAVGMRVLLISDYRIPVIKSFAAVPTGQDD